MPDTPPPPPAVPLPPADAPAWRQLAEGLADGMALFDAGLRLQVWNPAMFTLLRLEPALAVAGTPLREFLLALARRGAYGDVDPEQESDHRLARLLAPGPGQWQNSTGDGRTLELRRQCLDDGSLVLLCRDITERRASEQMLLADQRMLSLLLEGTEEGFWFIDNAQRSTDANRAMCRMLGLEREQIVGRSIYDFVDPENEAIFRDQVARRAQGAAGSYEIALRRSDGTLVHCYNSATPIYDGRGAKIGAVGLFSDISAQKRAAAELRRTSDLLEAKSRLLDATLQSLSQGVLYFGSDGRIEAWNRRAVELLQLPESLLQGRPLLRDVIEWQTRHGHLEDILRQPDSAPYRAIEEFLGGNAEALWIAPRYQRVRADGVVLEVQIHAAPNGAHVRTYTDVTASNRARQALIAARDEAERANRAKSEFLSRMSHELRTPLNAVLGFAQLIELDTEEPPLPGQRERVQQIQRGGAHLLRLINEVLDLSRIESGALALHVETVDVDAVVAECRRLVEPMARQHEVTLEIEGPEGGLGRIATDPTRLRQVLLNLLSNAIKYNRRGGQVRLAGVADERGVRLEVSDTGPGLSAEQQQRLFQAFDRLGADRGAVEGTGIGLALSKSLVDLMQGRIGVASASGSGSTFWVELPRDVQALVAPAAPPPALRAERRPWTGPPQRVLYIEDNPVNQIIVESMLGRLPGVLLELASDPLQGLASAIAHPPELVLLDIQLPQLSGYEVLQRLRAEPRTAAVPVIAVSANAMPEDVQRARDAGFDDYLSKPLELDGLLDAVVARLGR